MANRLRMIDRFYEHKARYDWWVLLALFAFVVLHVVLIIVFVVAKAALMAWIIAGMLVIYVLLCAVALPRGYQIHSEKLRIIFGGPLAWNIPLVTIDKVLVAPGSMARKNLGPV